MNALNISGFIWGIAADVLRDHYVRGKYRDVILPMTVIRRLDAVLEPRKEDVLRMKGQLDEAGITNQDRALRQASGEAFYNTSPFRLRDLRARARQQQLRSAFCWKSFWTARSTSARGRFSTRTAACGCPGWTTTAWARSSRS